MANKKRTPILTSPTGIAAWPYLVEPDVKFKPEGEYRIQLVLNPERDQSHAKFIADLKQIYADGYAEELVTQKKPKLKQVPLPIKPETDSDGNETGTGNVLLKFTMKAVITKKDGTSFNQRPMLFDAKGNPVQKARVGGGSLVRVAFQPNPFYTAGLGYGLQLRLQGVQILKLVEYGNRDAASMGFKAEDGYEFTADADTTSEPEAPAASAPTTTSEDGDY